MDIDKSEKKEPRKHKSKLISIGIIMMGVAVGIVFFQVTELFACEPKIIWLLDEITEIKEFYANDDSRIPDTKRIEFQMLAQQIIDKDCPNDTITITWEDVDVNTGEVVSREVFKTEPAWDKNK